MKEYLALVWGTPVPRKGRIETNIGRSVRDRKRMAVRLSTGRNAVTVYESVECYGGVTLVRVRIETGRTHQIRVHMAHLGHPVVGDRQYGRGRPGSALPGCVERQMLHAERLAFRHPRTGESMAFVAQAPDDMMRLMEALRNQGRGVKTQ